MTGSGFLDAILYLVVVALIFALLWWGLKEIALPEPFHKIIKALLVIAVVVVLIDFLLSFTSRGGFIHFH